MKEPQILSGCTVRAEMQKDALACVDQAEKAFARHYGREHRDLTDCTWIAGYAAALFDASSADSKTSFEPASFHVARLEGTAPDGTKHHVCIDDKWHVGARASCDRCTPPEGDHL